VGRRPRELAELRANVALVLQDPRSSLDPRMNVGRTITEPLRSPVLRRARSREETSAQLSKVMDEVGLDPESAGRFPHEFSGGQRQRIAIARALITRPAVLLADEPVSALDVSVRAQILNLLLELVAARGLTMVFVSHDLAVVRHLCDEVAVMQEGRIVESGPLASVYRDPQHRVTRDLLAAIPTIRI
jgi:peptide/nickel transport system ATP-binding protein